MKKLLLILLMLLILSLALFACDKKEAENDSDTSCGNSETLSEESSSINDILTEPIKIGTFSISKEYLEAINLTEEEIAFICENDEIIFFKKHIIFNNSKGKNVVLQLDEEKIVTRAEAYDEKFVEGYLDADSVVTFDPDESYSPISIFEAIEKYGMPDSVGEEYISYIAKGEENFYGLSIYFDDNGIEKESWVEGPDL